MKGKSAFIRSQLSLFKPFITKCSLGTVRHGQEKIGKLMAVSHRNDLCSETVKVGNMRCAMLVPKDELGSAVILYLHGGGYVGGNLEYAKGFASMLASRCGVRVFCPEYRLAPENVFPAAIDDAMEAYGYLLANGYEPSRILLCGESAGGGMCYSLCRKLREKGRSLPAGIIAISPWTDLTSSGESYTLNEKKDVSMTKERLKYFADAYIYGAERIGKKLHPRENPDKEADLLAKSDPLASPLFDSLEKMPPSLILCGEDEIMLDDSVKLHEKLIAKGCESDIVKAPGMWHGYVLYDLPEREGDFDKIRKFIKQRVPLQKKLRWITLDNAAKIFPAAKTKHWSNLFRLCATLNEEVDRAVLQTALDITVRRFPSMAVRLRTGVFWYSLEEIPAPPEVLDEKAHPLVRMPFDDIRRCAFRVLLYKDRIAVEFFHALTDGNGGLIFLKTLVSEYLYQKHGVHVPVGNGVLDRLEEPHPEEMEDSFLKYASGVPASRRDTDSFRIRGKREEDGYLTNTTFIIDSSYVLSEAKRRGVTLTAYTVAALIVAAQRVQRNRVMNPLRYKPIKVHVPVNLRKMFPSTTLRNFILCAAPGIDPRLGEYTFDEIVDIVSHQMKLQITEKNMRAMMTTNVNSEKNPLIRIAPLFIKNIVMKMIFDAVGEKKACFSFSNLGSVNMPKEFTDHVRRMDFVLGPQSSAPYNVSALGYGDKLYLNVTRNIREPVLERELFAVLRELGVPLVLESNTRG